MVAYSKVNPNEAPGTVGIYTHDEGGKVQVQYVDENSSQEVLYPLLASKNLAIVINLTQVVVRVVQQMLDKGYAKNGVI